MHGGCWPRRVGLGVWVPARGRVSGWHVARGGRVAGGPRAGELLRSGPPAVPPLVEERAVAFVQRKAMSGGGAGRHPVTLREKDLMLLPFRCRQTARPVTTCVKQHPLFEVGEGLRVLLGICGGGVQEHRGSRAAGSKGFCRVLQQQQQATGRSRVRLGLSICCRGHVVVGVSHHT